MYADLDTYAQAPLTLICSGLDSLCSVLYGENALW